MAAVLLQVSSVPHVLLTVPAQPGQQLVAALPTLLIYCPTEVGRGGGVAAYSFDLNVISKKFSIVFFS